MNKSLLGAFISVIAIAVIGWSIWSHNSTKNSIRNVLKEDAALPELVMSNAGPLDKYWDGSMLVMDIVGRMKKIDISGCPSDFQVAYKRHIAAWEAVACVKRNYEGWNGFLKGLLSLGKSVVTTQSAYDESQRELQSTWSEVERVAIKHGVVP